jgi:AcrR family transcriptional regulator
MSRGLQKADSGFGDLQGDRRSLTKGERQRQAILASLVEQLRTKPIGDLTVGEIAAAAGVQRSNYYSYFESKYSALAVVDAEIWSDLIDRVEIFARAPSDSVDEFLRVASAATAEVWKTHDAVLIASIQALPADEQIASMWRDWNTRITDIVTEKIRKVNADKHGDPLSPDLRYRVATLMEMTLHMFYKDRVDRCAEEETQRMLDTVRAIWLASLWDD